MFLSLQYLRGLAALAVVYFHTYGKIGAQGVTLFFVISGFIMAHLMQTKHRTWQIFFMARLLRVAPLYWILSLLTLALGFAYDPTVQRIVLSLSFLSLGTILPVGWTLTYEFIFYSLCTFSIFALRGVNRQMAATALLLVLADAALSLLLLSRGLSYGHYFLLFILGLAVYRLHARHAAATLPSLFIVALLAASLALLALPYLLGLAPLMVLFCDALAAFGIVWSLLVLESRQQLPNSAILLALGNASYSIYLTHYITIHAVGHYAPNAPNALLILLSVAVGLVCYRLLEAPLVRLAHERLQRAKRA